jgi:hypothetical protein
LEIPAAENFIGCRSATLKQDPEALSLGFQGLMESQEQFRHIRPRDGHLVPRMQEDLFIGLPDPLKTLV